MFCNCKAELDNIKKRLDLLESDLKWGFDLYDFYSINGHPTDPKKVQVLKEIRQLAEFCGYKRVVTPQDPVKIEYLKMEDKK